VNGKGSEKMELQITGIPMSTKQKGKERGLKSKNGKEVKE
jgi:hypothetical protein